MIAAKVIEEGIPGAAIVPSVAPRIGLEQYYSEAGPDCAASHLAGQRKASAC